MIRLVIKHEWIIWRQMMREGNSRLRGRCDKDTKE